MGDESPWAYPGDGEGPVHEVELAAFRIDRYAVTNEQFSRFVGGHEVAYRRRAVRMVLRVWRTPPRRLPPYSSSGGRAMVAPGDGGRLATS